MEIVRLNWAQADRLSLKLAMSVADRYKDDAFRPDVIVAISRGGFVPARILCDVLSIKKLASLQIEHYAGMGRTNGVPKIIFPLPINFVHDQVLLVDDIADRGDSLIAAKQHILLNGRGSMFPIRTATLHYKKRSSIKPDYYAEQVPDDSWIVYPWERIESFVHSQKGKSPIAAIRIELEEAENK